MSGISKTVYLCNPELNTKCSKTGCGYTHEDGPCFRTSNPEFAEIGDDGQPIEATDGNVRDWKINGWIGYGIHLSSGYEKEGGCNGDYCEL